MVQSDRQASELINRLYDRTKLGILQWERSVEPKKYQLRHGNFLLKIGPETFSGVILSVYRLDGALVESFSSEQNALAMTVTVTGDFKPRGLSVETRERLSALYSMISDHNDELAELISTL